MDDKLVLLRPEFRRKLFKTSVAEFGTQVKAAEKLGMARGTLVHYLHKAKFVDYSAALKAASLTGLKKELRENIVKFKSRKRSNNEVLRVGRQKRLNQLKKLRNPEIELKKILVGGKSLIARWFKASNKVTLMRASPLISQINVTEKKDELVLHYAVLKKTFKTIIPKHLVLDEDFAYFFGLWLGDKAGGGRFGITNQDEGILKKTLKVLKKKFLQKEVRLDVLMPRKGEHKIPLFLTSLPRKSFIGKRNHKPTFVVYSLNAPLKGFFEWLSRPTNLRGLYAGFNNLKKNAFLAGFFDAEGHVNPIDCNLKFCQKGKTLKKFLFEALQEFGARQDDSSIVVKDVGRIGRTMLPFLNSRKKQGVAKLLAGDTTKQSYSLIALWLKRNPTSNRKKVAKAFNKKRLHYILPALIEAGYIKKDKKGFVVTRLGEEWVEANKGYITDLLKEAWLFGKTTEGKLSFDSKAIESMAGVMQVC